jgi:two-component system cell cycle response regulator
MKVGTTRGKGSLHVVSSSRTACRAPLRCARWFYPLVSVGLGSGTLLAVWVPAPQLHRTVAIAVTVGLWFFLGWMVGLRQDRMASLSAIDSSTGLFNRRHFEPRLEREVRRATLGGRPVALLIIDIDSLKTINDRLGHLAGDRAIRAVAEALRRVCRANEVPARWGGDEFVLLARDTDLSGAGALAERLADTIRETAAAHHARSVIHGQKSAPGVTVSVGIAVADAAHPELSSAALFSEADRALYEEKARSHAAARQVSHAFR